MKDNQPFHNSRLKQREKRRKTNLILNSLIAIVLVLIVIVSIQIFFTDDKQTDIASEQTEQATTEERADSGHETDSSAVKKVQRDEQDMAGVEEKEHEKKTKDNKTEDNESTNDEQDAKEEKNAEDIEDEAIVTEGGNDPNVTRTIVNPGWEPVGTVQTGEHHSVYSGIDWDEMVQAISYATGIDKNNMTIYHLGNNGPNKSVGTIQDKGTKQKYRVYIEWVDEKGWKPTLVEELAE